MSFSRLTLGSLLLPALMAFALPVGAADTPFGVTLPNPNIPGYNFPEPEPVILGWVNNQPAKSSNIYLHGWGLWTSLNMPSGQSTFGLKNAPVYLTWKSKQELEALTVESVAANGEKAAKQKPAPRQLSLGPVSQHLKFGIRTTLDKAVKAATSTAAEAAPVPAPANGTTPTTPDATVFETVSYSPDASQWILQGGLFKLSTFKALYAQNQKEIPVFPNTAVSLKPVYKVISKNGGHLINGRYYAMPAWPGTPEVTQEIIDNGFPEQSWNAGCVYVDIQNKGPSAAKGTDASCKVPTPDSTYGLGDFVTIPVTADNLSQLKVDGLDVAVGDTLILVAMHVTSREIAEWTWQTFFWTPDPANPPTPSDKAVAAARPLGQLKGAPAHYAASFAYQMIAPNQPVDGGNNVGKPVIGYNPYLESGFNGAVFGVKVPVIDPATKVAWVGQVGVQTNCMTCHAMATVAMAPGAQNYYTTNFWIGRNDPLYNGTVQADFLWSIADVVGSQQAKQNN
ncbi:MULTISPECIES: hypothetical protein [unclassified Azospirillum]|uniref:hypothetical protein n=1 Tax=unclassified Azospirillum TaxID=2630922 RepID=UPI000B66386C|nr:MULTISPECIES: hypothetical protein [unclassified Azospirillum]SNR86704.1 hypothetical protein SAMN05880556_101230 [Azospirillum sp. RU38E]SNS02838.1 hypothetical protein SAMN05880591_101230 [Azospirillum sp. RU37A]